MPRRRQHPANDQDDYQGGGPVSRPITRRWDFLLALHRAAAPDPARDMCWSPYSVSAALGLAAAAARGATRDEVLAVLTGGADVETCARLLSLAAGPGGGAELALASTAWLRADATVADGFPEALAPWPAAALRTFGPDPDQTRRTINADVAECTRGLIAELLGANALTAETVALLVNALYLRTAWLHQFDPDATRPRPFHAPTGPVEVPTMELVAELGQAGTGRWQVVTLPALGGVDTTVLLPHGPLDAAEEALTGDELDDLLTPHPSRRVRLRLPKLGMSWGDDLSDALRACGVRTLFDPDRADLSGLTPMRPTWVSKVIHQAVLRIDEHGMEGAAATAMTIAGRALGPPLAEPLLVAVDRPFLLLVSHRGTGSIYFLARVTDPS
jgi:serine protease inhibitor